MFTNTELFRTEAKKFEKDNRYCDYPILSLGWINYWEEQLKRCKEGYSVGGTKITGNHYFYLNFCRINLTSEEDEKAVKERRKKLAFPDFWDGDYEYFHIVDKAKEQGKHLCIGKARRKGYSFKNGSICANKYNTQRNSTTVIGAFDKKYLFPTGTMSMALDYLNFLNEHTGWAKKSQVVNKQEFRRASYKQVINGIEIEKGYKSQILALTFKDNPDAARGKDGSLILFEECGKWPNLKASYLTTKPSVEDGIYTTGQIILYGTGGSMEEGATLDFYELFYNPEPYNIMSFENIWDENEHGRCSYFVPDYKNKVGFMDRDGNSNLEGAKEYEEALRSSIARKSKDKRTLIRHTTEHAFNPREAFFLSTANIFPVADLKHRLGYLEANERIRTADYIGHLIIEEDGLVKWKEDTKLLPITDYPLKHNTMTEGCIVIYNMPYTDEEGKVPSGMYLSGTDPYNQDQAETGSLGSTLIYDKVNKKIVAEYTARPSTAKQYYENVRRLLMFYNCRSLYENQIKGLFDYFESRQCLYLLADEPDIIHDIIQDSRVSRKKGMHMTDALKDYGENLINQWLLEEREDKTLNLHKIRSIPLLKELISYRPGVNADRIISLMMVLYYEAEVRKQKVSKNVEIITVLDDPFWKRDIYKKQPIYF